MPDAQTEVNSHALDALTPIRVHEELTFGQGMGHEKLYTIMAIDDTINNLDLLKDMLTKAGYKVKPFTNGTEAVKAAEKTQPDLILLDINMPDLNGFEICKILKENEKLKNIPIIFLSALNETEDKVMAFKAGGIDYITKPFQFEEVEARVRTHLNLKIAQEQLIIAGKMASLGELVAGVAHEVNSPLGTCITAVSYLTENIEKLADTFSKDQLTSEELESFLQKGKESSEIITKNLGRIVNLIYIFKQVSADNFREEKQEVEIGEYINLILRTLSMELNSHHHEVTLEIEKDTVIKSFPSAILQIFRHLILNSIMHGFEYVEGGKILIKITKKENKVIIIYKDNGKGISANNIKKVFEPFFTTKRGSGRIGLGLHIVFNLVNQLLDGSIKCRSEDGEYTEFEIVIGDGLNS